MKLSTKGRYGVRALVELASRYNKGLVLVKQLAKDQEISEKYLERIIANLKAAGFVKSNRGAKGGYELSRDPSGINLLEVIRALEGSLAPVDCVDDAKLCNKVGWCVTRNVWSKLKDSIESTLGSVTLKTLADEYLKNRGLKTKMYYI